MVEIDKGRLGEFIVQPRDRATPEQKEEVVRLIDPAKVGKQKVDERCESARAGEPFNSIF